MSLGPMMKHLPLPRRGWQPCLELAKAPPSSARERLEAARPALAIPRKRNPPFFASLARSAEWSERWTPDR